VNAFGRIGYFARETFTSIFRNLAMSIACVITIAISLLMFGGALIWIQWTDSGTAVWRGGVEFQIFMNVDATDSEIADVKKALDDDEDVDRAIYVSREDAYEEFKVLFKDEPELVESASPEILPPSFRVVPANLESANQVEELQRRYETRPGVDQIRTPLEQVKERLSQANLVKWVLWILALVLLVSAGILIVFTVRLATLARRREIEVMKLVGASNWFVRIPFMAEGGVQGLVGAAVAGVGTLGMAFAIPKIFDGQTWNGYSLSSTTVMLTVIGIMLVGLVIGIASAFVGLVRFLDV